MSDSGKPDVLQAGMSRSGQISIELERLTSALEQERARSRRLEEELRRLGERTRRDDAADLFLQVNQRLRELRRAVLSCSSFSQVAEPILEAALEVCQLEGGAVYLVEGDTAVLHAHQGLTEELVGQVREVSLRLPAVEHVLNAGGVVDLGREFPERLEHYRTYGVQDGFSLTFRDARGVAGFIILASLNPTPPEPERLEALELLASEIEPLLARFSTEQALRESQSRISSIFRAAPSGIGLVVNRVLTEVNERVCEMVGYSKAELIGQSSRVLYPSDEDFEYVGTEKYRQIRSHGTGTVETRWRRRDGTIIDVLLSSTALDPDNLAAGVTFAATDISELKRNQARLRRLRMAIDQASEIIVVTEPDGAISYVNPAFERVTGYSREEVLGENPRLLQSGVHDKTFYAELWGTLLSGKTWTGRLTNRRKNGEHYIEEATISPVRSPQGEIISFVAVKRDITTELELQAQLQQAQKMEAVGLLAGGIAHDFNNIIQVILGYSEIVLAQANLTGVLRERVEQIIAAAERAATLIRQLLAFSRRQVLQLVEVDLNKVVADLISLVRRVIGEHISLVVEPGSALAGVRIDVGQIEQILMNLVVNARDAMQDGGRITIATHNVELDEVACRYNAWARPGRYVLLSVTDTGHGISKEMLDLIYEPFFTTKQVGEGTGLGLAMVYGIVKQHGGLLNAKSTPGRGTEMQVYLPVAEAEDKDAGLQEPEVAVQLAGDETVLLAEDEEVVRQLATSMLESAGYTVLAAEDGEKALAVYRAHRDEIALTILDVVMPKLGGMAVFHAIRELAPEARVLFTTGYSTRRLGDDIMSQAVVSLIPKPYRTRQLLLAARELLDRKDAS